MAEESLKEILLNLKTGDYDKMMKHCITQEDILDFNNLYSEFVSLEKKYQHMILGRSKTSKDLIKKLELLQQMGMLITREIELKKSHYENFVKDIGDVSVNDYHKVFEVLRQLAKNDSVQYEIKTILYSTVDGRECHGYRTTEEYTSEITILAERKSISKFNSSKKLSCLTRDMLLDVYNQGYSVILTGNDEYMTEMLELPNKQTLGLYRPIVFYLQDDELANATSSFISFIEENGPDIDQIGVDDLVQIIKSKYQKTKKLI